MRDARVVPGNRLLVGVEVVVLGGHVVAEENVRERLEAVRVPARNVDRPGISVADVLGERLVGLEIEDDHSRPAA